MHGTGESSVFGLAERLRKLPQEIRDMPHRDFVGLLNFYHVKGVLDDLAHDTAVARSRAL